MRGILPGDRDARVGNVALTAEDFERALTYYNTSLDLEPRAMDGLIEKSRR